MSNFLLSIVERPYATGKRSIVLLSCQAGSEEQAHRVASNEYPGCTVLWVAGANDATEIPIDVLCDLWNDLADVPINHADEILEPFLFFPALTHRESIWRWFEKKNLAFIVGEVGQRIGDEHPFRAVAQRYVIFSPSEAQSDGAGYWSNEDGWVDLGSATFFTKDEVTTLNLPVSSGGDAKWMLGTQARQH